MWWMAAPALMHGRGPHIYTAGALAPSALPRIPGMGMYRAEMRWTVGAPGPSARPPERMTGGSWLIMTIFTAIVTILPLIPERQS